MENETQTLMTPTPEGGEQNTSATNTPTQPTDAATTQAAPPKDTGTGEKTDGDAPPKQDGAPDAYDFKAPEGIDVDGGVFEKFSEVAKGLNLSQDKAQSVIDTMTPIIAARQKARLEAAVVQWEADARADAEYGGAKLDENLALANKALNAFATPALHALLKESGLSNHPEIVRLFYRAGKAIGEDGFVAGRAAPEQGGSMEARLYPNEFNRNPS
jgi:hypothetical protein